SQDFFEPPRSCWLTTPYYPTPQLIVAENQTDEHAFRGDLPDQVSIRRTLIIHHKDTLTRGPINLKRTPLQTLSE
ncbi:MAG: hypothetical protein KC594_10450, partial [Nitrospira sp.]|nr:hypothetical protein [Nitrospira sp.]